MRSSFNQVTPTNLDGPCRSYDPGTNTLTAGPSAGSGSNKYDAGVVLLDGRVVLVPWNVATVGLCNGTSARPAYTVSGSMPASWGTLLLPYYNKF